MKKNTLLFCLAVLLVIFLCSCGGGLLPGNQVGVMVTNWNAGPGVSQATVTVFESGTQKVIGNGVSNKNGGVIVNLSAKPELIDISVVKEGHARSFVSGLKSTFAVNQIFPIILQSALLENDPGIETDPTVTIQWELMAPQTTRDVGPSQELVKGPFEVTVTVEGVRQTRVIYEPLLDSIPGSASVTLNSGLSRFADTATFEVAPTGFDGEVPLYTTVYDSNNNRVVKVIYLAIEGTDPEGVQMYQPMPLVDFSERVGDYPIENIRSYTRRDSENLRNEGRTAPAETNLWTQLYWTDWTSLDDYYGPGSLLPDPGDQPDGYNLYRSGDGEVYQKFAFIPESYVGGLAKQICEAYDIWLDIDRVVNTNPMAKDGSFYVFPEYPIYYRITSVYGTLESTPTDLGSVNPLDVFEVVLDSPSDNETGTSLTPTFQWHPSQTLTSEEGTPVYYYGLYIEQRDANENEILAAVDEQGFFRFPRNTADAMDITFMGNAQNPEWGCVWKWYNGETGLYRDYDFTELINGKQYRWFVPLAYAVVQDEDSKAFSIASDYKFIASGWGIDPFGGFMFGENFKFETTTD